jgi:acetyl-CoA carboxylase biotin carboxyl carrier protein
MPDQPTEPSETPDVRTIRHLVRLMQRYDLTAIDLVEGQTKIRLRRRGSEAYPAPSAPPPPASTATPVAAPARPEPTPTLAEPAAQGALIRSPMVGTFYASSAPDAPPFVTVGVVVRPETTICVIEAMKVFTDIPAGIAGTITEILVKNGQPVEFDQPLFRVSQE